MANLTLIYIDKPKTRTMRKIYFRRFAAMAILVSVFGIGTIVAQTFSGGAGTMADPYKIGTAQDLMDLDTAKMMWAGDTLHWILTHDIDMTAKLVVPIGYKGMPFMGEELV